MLPEAVDRRYRLAKVDVDLIRFPELHAQAAAAEAPRARELLTDALKLVRGRPFADVDYPWTPMISARVERQIAEAAQRLALLSREARDRDATRWAAEQGLAGLTQPDARLLGFVLYAGAAQGPSELTHAWSEATARCAAVGDVPGEELVALYDRLRTAQERF